MSDLNDLRQVARQQDNEPAARVEIPEQIGDDRLFGLTAVERMFLSIGLFLISLFFSLVLLLGTNSIAF
ncbi:MAG: hypothetical protein ACLFTK_09170 [Anaerolineales bacterium]